MFGEIYALARIGFSFLVVQVVDMWVDSGCPDWLLTLMCNFIESGTV